MGSIRLANWLPFNKIGEFFRKSEVFWKWAIKVMIWTRVSWRESLLKTYRIDHISGVSDYYPIIIGEIEFNWWSVRFLSDRSQWIMSWDLLWYHDRREADLSIAKNFSGISNCDLTESRGRLNLKSCQIPTFGKLHFFSILKLFWKSRIGIILVKSFKKVILVV